MWRTCSTVCLTLTFALAAQQQEPVSPSPETFRAVTRLVVLGVVVTDKSGHPVKGLKREDFAVREDTGPQNIAPEQRSQVPAVVEGKQGTLLTREQVPSQ